MKKKEMMCLAVVWLATLISCGDAKPVKGVADDKPQNDTSAVVEKKDSAQQEAETKAAMEKKLDFESAIRLLQATIGEWKPVEGKILEASGLQLVVNDKWREDGEEFDNVVIIYGKNVEETLDNTHFYQSKSTGVHACELRITADTSSRAEMNFWDKADYDDFVSQAEQYGIVRIREGLGDFDYIPARRTGKVKIIRGDDMEQEELVCSFDRTGDDGLGRYAVHLSLDF